MRTMEMSASFIKASTQERRFTLGPNPAPNSPRLWAEWERLWAEWDATYCMGGEL